MTVCAIVSPTSAMLASRLSPLRTRKFKRTSTERSPPIQTIISSPRFIAPVLSQPSSARQPGDSLSGAPRQQRAADGLGGNGETATSTWELRRETILDLLGKATPFAFTPALQINPEARLLVESLSGRWSYEKDRRDHRNIWYHVANALGLVVGRLQEPKAEEYKPPEVIYEPIYHFGKP